MFKLFYVNSGDWFIPACIWVVSQPRLVSPLACSSHHKSTCRWVTFTRQLLEAHLPHLTTYWPWNLTAWHAKCRQTRYSPGFIVGRCLFFRTLSLADSGDPSCKWDSYRDRNPSPAVRPHRHEPFEGPGQEKHARNSWVRLMAVRARNTSKPRRASDSRVTLNRELRRTWLSSSSFEQICIAFTHSPREAWPHQPRAQSWH